LSQKWLRLSLKWTSVSPWFEGTVTPQPRDGASEAGTPLPVNHELEA
jgi:hypothetical protein